MNEVRIGGTLCVVLQCGSCAVWHTVPRIKYDSCMKEGGFWSCPNGHNRGWAQGTDNQEIDKLRRERDRLKQESARLQDGILEQQVRADMAEKKALAIKRRATAGVCPCCTRTFTNVQRHMKTKHPNIVPMAQKAN